MTLVNLSAARRIAQQTGLAVREARIVGSQHGYEHLMLALAGGQRAFAKVAAAQEAPPAELAAAFAAEASGLDWLAEADAVPVPGVLAVTETALVISMIPAGSASPSAAFRFGTELARMHATGVRHFGAPWRGSSPACRWTIHRTGRPGRSGTPAAGCCPTSGWRWIPALASRGRTAGGGGDRPDRLAGRAGRAAEPHSR